MGSVRHSNGMKGDKKIGNIHFGDLYIKGQNHRGDSDNRIS